MIKLVKGPEKELMTPLHCILHGDQQPSRDTAVPGRKSEADVNALETTRYLDSKHIVVFPDQTATKVSP